MFRIIQNFERGYYARSNLALNRYEILVAAQGYVSALRKNGGRTPFKLPRAFCGPFGAREAQLPARYDEQTEADLAEIFWALDGDLPRSEKEHWDNQIRGGNLAITDHLKLPEFPGVTLDQLDDASYAEAFYGKNSSFNAAWEKMREALYPKLISASDKRIYKWMGIGSILLFAAALIAHRLKTGTW